MSEAQWERIKGALPGRVEHVGRTALNNRQFVNGVFWVPRSGARWHDLPERHGKYKSVHARFMRWARSGVWARVFADLVADKNNQYVMIDSTIVRAHQQAATGRKKWDRKTRLRGVPDRTLYKQRNLIERRFNRLKQFRRFSTRCCRTIEAFRSFTALACAWIRLQLYVDTA